MGVAVKDNVFGWFQHAEFIFEIRFHPRGREMGQPENMPVSPYVTLSWGAGRGPDGEGGSSRSPVGRIAPLRRVTCSVFNRREAARHIGSRYNRM